MSKITFDKNLCEEIERGYEAALKTFGKKAEAISTLVAQKSGNEALFLKYLYAHMPVSDACGYSFEVIDSYASHGAFLAESSEFLQGVPARFFLQYVLAHRINSEDITDCRSFFYDLVQKRVQGMTRAQAALEANNWCYEQATYRSTSIRTESPLTMYYSGFGRCGEESTFLTTVLRSLGIPARQVYVPRWSHSDSNHAWVEIWCEDGWHFTGACEPNPILDCGWFPYAASRAMVVHSRLFDDASSTDEEITETDGLAVLLNESARYSYQTGLRVTVKDENGAPVSDARVDFEIVNSAEFFPIASLRTDSRGIVNIHLGKGDLHIAVTKEGSYAEAFADLRNTDEVTLTLTGERQESEKWQPYHINAPESADGFAASMTHEQEEEQGKRNAVGDVIRNTRIDSYFNEGFAGKWESYENIANALKRSKGNFETFRQFLTNDYQGISNADKDALLSGLSEKDCRDISIEVLEDSLSAFEYRGTVPAEIFNRDILSPRLHYARTTTFRSYIAKNCGNLKELAQKDPVKLWQWIDENIKTDSAREYLTIISDPEAALTAGSASQLSKYVLFTAICRTFGRASRIDFTYERPMYYDKDRFVYVQPEFEKTGKLILTCNDKKKPEYGQSYTIARQLESGIYETVGAWFSEFKDNKCELELTEGQYRLLTCERTSSGSIAGSMLYFELREGETKEFTMTVRELKREDFIERHTIPVIKACALESVALGSAVSAGNALEGVTANGKKRSVVIFAKPGNEPTEHVFNELLEISKMGGLPEGGLEIILENGEAANDPTLKAVRKSYPYARLWIGDFDDTIAQIASATGVMISNLPYCTVIEGENMSLYCCSGYNVGCVDIFARLLSDEN